MATSKPRGPKKRHIKIRRQKTGKKKGQFRFKQVGDNYKDVSPNDSYKNRKDLIDMCKEYYPDFEIIDET